MHLPTGEFSPAKAQEGGCKSERPPTRANAPVLHGLPQDLEGIGKAFSPGNAESTGRGPATSLVSGPVERFLSCAPKAGSSSVEIGHQCRSRRTIMATQSVQPTVLTAPGSSLRLFVCQLTS